mgnify:CR=1 FL=1
MKDIDRETQIHFLESNVKDLQTQLNQAYKRIVDLINTLEELKQNDLILGPSNDGGYWLIGLSSKIISKYLNLPFINIRWSKENVLNNTINNFASTKLKYKLLNKKIDIDTIFDIENRK